MDSPSGPFKTISEPLIFLNLRISLFFIENEIKSQTCLRSSLQTNSRLNYMEVAFAVKIQKNRTIRFTQT